MLFYVSIFRPHLQSNHKDLNKVTEETINVNNLYHVKLKVQLTNTEKEKVGRRKEKLDANILS